MRAELLLGQPSKYTFCTQYTVLLDEMSKLPSHVKVVVVSCLSNIIAKIGASNDPKTGIERAMKTMAAAFFELINQRSGHIRILVAQCTPRASQEYTANNKFAMVSAILFSF